MKKEKRSTADAAGLRKRAENLLKAGSPSASAISLTNAGLQKLLHELQVHQIELKMQNEELLTAKAEVEAALERYTDFYDFSPVSFVSLDCNGVIRAINLIGAGLLGVERARLPGRRFEQFIAAETRQDWKDFFVRVFGRRAKTFCEVTLETRSNLYRQVRVEALVSRDRQECRAVIIDLTESKIAQEAIVRKSNALEEVIAHIDIEKNKLRENISANVKKVVLPLLKKLPLKDDYRHYKKMLEEQLSDLASSFGSVITANVSGSKFMLTAKEIEICSMIRSGMKNKEIAQALWNAVSTVETERKHIRKKLRLTNTKTNLSTMLQRFE
jgi:PAS domain S-box-containing protein